MTMSTAEKSARYRAKDVEAYRARKAAYARTPEERAKRTAYMRVWREENRERHNELARQSHHRNKHKHAHKARERHLRYVYGITTADYDRMLAEQGGCCAICGTAEVGAARRYFHVDHDHTTGRVRGLLCVKCNTSLPFYERYHEVIDGYLTKRTLAYGE